MLGGLRVAVTGATGNLGTHFCARLEALGAEPVPLVLPGYPSLPKRARWTARTTPIAVADSEGLVGLGAVDALVHLHWRTSRDGSAASQLVREVEWNVGDLDWLWAWAASVPTIVNVSSLRALTAVTPYGMAKRTVEMFTESAVSAKTRLVHARLCSIFAASEHPSQLVSQLWRASFANGTARLRANDWVYLMYVDEAVDHLIALILNNCSGAVEIAAPPVRVADVATEFAEVAGQAARLEILTPNPPSPRPELHLLPQALPWCRRLSLSEGIAAFLGEAAGNDLRSA